MSLSRRRFFQGAAATGLTGMLGSTALTAGLDPSAVKQANGPHFAPKARRVIYLHMEGGPSHLDLFDHKPDLHKLYDTELPDSVRGGQRLTGMTSGQKRFPVAPSLFRFDKHDNGGDGVYMSELLPNLGKVANELCVVRSMHTDAINHEPAITFAQTGNQHIAVEEDRDEAAARFEGRGQLLHTLVHLCGLFRDTVLRQCVHPFERLVVSGEWIKGQAEVIIFRAQTVR